MFRGAKRRSKSRKQPFSITVDDIQIPDQCPALNIPLRPNTGGKAQSDNSPTLDRIIPKRGYVPGNVIVVSNLANRIRTNATVDQLLKVATFYQYLLSESEDH